MCAHREALRRDNQPLADAFGRFCWTRSPAQSRQRQPTILSLRRQSGGRGLRRDECMGAIGSTARSLATKSQTNLVVSVRSASFASAAPRKLVALTAIADVLGDRRSLAPYCWCLGRAKPRGHIAGLGRYAEHRGLCCLAGLGAPLSVPVSAVCDRRNEREHPAKSAKLSAAANGAGGKLTSPASGAGGTVRKVRPSPQR